MLRSESWDPSPATSHMQVIDADVDTALTDGNISGLTLWHFFDFKGKAGV